METNVQFLTCSLKLDDQTTSLHISDYDKTIHKNNIFCKCCDTPMIGKKGTIKQHHYAHKTNEECDSWLWHKTDWHLFWQNLFNKEKQEVIIIKGEKKHIADIVSNELVIEIQHSAISHEDITLREQFYGNVIWLLDGNNCTYELCDMVDYHDDKIVYTLAKIKKSWIQFISKEAYINTGDVIYKIIKHINDGYFILQKIPMDNFMKIIGADEKLNKNDIQWMYNQNIDKKEIIKYKDKDEIIAGKWDNKHFYIISDFFIDGIDDNIRKICIKECHICDYDRILKRKNVEEQKRINNDKCDIVDNYWKAKILDYKKFIENELLNYENIADIKSNISDIIVKQLQEQTNIIVNIHNHEMIKQMKCTTDKKNEILNNILCNLRNDQEINKQNIIANSIVDKIFKFELPSKQLS